MLNFCKTGKYTPGIHVTHIVLLPVTHRRLDRIRVQKLLRNGRVLYITELRQVR